MEKGLEVDENRMFAARDEIAAVEVRAIQEIEDSDVRPLSLVEPSHLIARSAFGCFDVLRPSVAVAVENRHRSEGRLAAARVQPSQEVLKMDVDGKGFGFVDQTATGGESEDENGSASAMWICQPSGGSGEH